MEFEVCDINDVVEDSLVRKTVGNIDILLVKSGEQIKIIAANCPHGGGPLEDGSLLEGLIVCSWHRSTFRLDDGKCLHGPSRVSLSCFRPILRGSKIYIDL